MRTVNQTQVRAPIETVFRVAGDVERWPEFLPHYRWVRMLERTSRGGTVEMAAWRHFGVLKYPTWWVSEMGVVPERHEVHYRHVRGLTRGMDVVWRLEADGDGVAVTIVHEWDGPVWPLIAGIAAEWVIGPMFIHAIAARTLAGVKRKAERDA